MENTTAQTSSASIDTQIDIAGLKEISQRLKGTSAGKSGFVRTLQEALSGRRAASKVGRRRESIALAGQLDSLIESLMMPNQLEASEWAGVNIFSVFNPADMARVLNPHAELARFGEVLRNVSIFAPLFVTWIHLSSSGGGEDFVREIQSVVGGVIAGLAAIVVFTVLTEGAQHVRELNIAEDEEHVSRLLRPVSLRLVNARAGQPHVLIDEFRSMSLELRRSMEEHHQRVNAMTTSQEHELAELRAFRDGLQSEITSLREVGDGMSHAATNMHSAIESLTQRSVQLAAHDAELIQNTKNLVVQISEVVDVQKNTSRSFTAQSDTLERSMQSMDVSQRALAPIVERFTQTANSLELFHGQFVMRMAEYLQQQQGLTENFQIAVQGFQGVSPMIDRLGGTVDVMQAQVGELAARIHQSGRTMEQVVNGITMASQQQLQSAGRMDAQSSQLSTAMGSFEQGLVGLVPKLAAMADVADAMRNMHREFLTKMSDLVVQQTDAATGFSGTADQMSAAVVRLDVVAHMVDRLGGAVDLMQAQVGKLTVQIDQSGRTMEQVGAGITFAAQQQQQTSGRMDAQSSQLSTAMGSFEQGLVGLVPKLAVMVDVADAMRHMHREFLVKMSELVVQQTDVSSELSGTADRMSNAIVVFGNIDDAVKSLRSQIQSLVGTTAQSGTNASQLMRQLEEMARSTRTAADVIRDSVSLQKDVLVQFNGGQQRTGNVIDRLDVAIKMTESMLQQIAVTQNEFRAGFREYVEREKATLNSVLEGYQAEKAKGSLVNRIGSIWGGGKRNEDAN
jgi:hypothetical protein